MNKTVQITVSGKVQGVFFRAAAKNKADELGIKGIVKNVSNGDVCIEASGTATNLQEFINWCYLAPQHASVTHVSVTETEHKVFVGFQVLR